MAANKHLVKRHGHTESFDPRKVYASVYASALNAHLSEHDAEDLADHVTKEVKKWARQHDVITSNQIRDHIIKAIPNPDVQLLYKHHLDLS